MIEDERVAVGPAGLPQVHAGEGRRAAAAAAAGVLHAGELAARRRHGPRRGGAHGRGGAIGGPE